METGETTLSKRIRAILSMGLLLALAAASVGLTGCQQRQSTVTVRTGEIVLCTEGEIVSDTTVEKEVPADEVDQYKVTTRVEVCDLHAKLAALYADGQRALDSGDLQGAQRLLAEVVAQDPRFRRAPQQLADLEAGRTPPVDVAIVPRPGTSPRPTTPGVTPPDPDGGGDRTDAPPPVDEGPISLFLPYTPDTLPGLNGQELIVDAFVFTRHYVPTSQDTFRGFVVVVEQFADAAAARKRMDTAIRSSYPQAGRSFTLKGDPAYFGVNGPVAVVAFLQGNLLVALEGTAVGDDGARIERDMMTLAERLAR